MQSVAFSAQTNLQFLATVFNIGGGIDSSANKFITPRCRLYWTHLEIRTNLASILANFFVVSSIFSILKNGTSVSDYTTLSRQDLRWIPGGTQMLVASPSFNCQY